MSEYRRNTDRRNAETERRDQETQERFIQQAQSNAQRQINNMAPQTRKEILADVQSTYKDILKAPELTKISFKDEGGYGTTQDAFKKLLQKQMGGLEGYTSEENAAIRGQQTLQTQRGEALARRQLAAQQAMGGVSGGAAARGQQQLAQQMAGTRAANEQSLAIANIEEKQKDSRLHNKQ